MSDTDFERQIDAFRRDCDAIVAQVASVIVGHQDVIDQTLTCLLAGGHALLEGVPGLGKTLLVRTLAAATDLTFSRIQFTPDLMPADITGTTVIEDDAQGRKHFRFQEGPVFAHLILADEINRATPKTQSAVLEAMQERTVTVARTTHALPQPFMVLATQNPLELEGTYPLPEAQLDRFMLKVLLRSPAAAELTDILTRTTADEPSPPKAVLTAERLLAMRQTVRAVEMASPVADYVSRIVLATHPPEADDDRIRTAVRYGASPRGGQAMVLAAKVRALRQGRANVSYDDVAVAAPASLRHRLILSFEGQADGVDPDEIIAHVVAATPR